ncbi:MAG: hypothetical protein NZ898_11970 [Myxococcota bacterium]|nr:hypothetical protein [Myxococcota bacterium]MDW8360912.1 hypothetical protein [Myxococcales bacterium]
MRLARWLGMVLVALPSWGAFAQPTDVACRRAVREWIQNHPSRLLAPVRTSFLTQGRTWVDRVELSQDGCVGVVAVGSAALADLDLVLYAEDIEVSRDEERDAHPYARFCGSRGLPLVAAVRAHRGQGEILLAWFREAPPRLGGVDAALFACDVAMGWTTEPPDLGPEPPREDAATLLERWERRLVSRGYAQVMTDTAPVSPGEPFGSDFEAEPDRCYLGLGVSTDAGVILSVVAPDGGVVARAPGRDGVAVARFCASGPGRWRVEIQRDAPDVGPVAMALHRLREPEVRPSGLDAFARFQWAELWASLETRAMRPRPVAWVQLDAGETLSVPVTLGRGRCGAFAVIRTGDLADSSVWLALTDREGNVRATDEVAELPLVWWCAGSASDEPMRVHVGPWNGTGRMLVVAADEAVATAGP